MQRKTYLFLLVAVLLAISFLAVFSDTSFAADTITASPSISESQFVEKMQKDMSAGFGTDFTKNLSTLFQSLQSAARVIVIMLTATAGFMIALGVSSVNQVFLKWIFGIGVVLNVADFGWSMFSDYWVADSAVTSPDVSEQLKNLTEARNGDKVRTDVFSTFMQYFSLGFISPAFSRIMPIAVKLTVALWLIDVSMKVALGLLQQDLVNFFIKQILKLGIYLFLITNWWPAVYGNASALSGTAGGNLALMESLGKGFQQLGYYAAGGGIADSGDGTSDDSKDQIALQADSIYENTMMLWSKVWELEGNTDGMGLVNLVGSVLSSGGMSIILGLLILVGVVICLFYLAIEMFMVRVEFYTMAVLTVMLLPFAMIDQLKFLADKAISLMFNLAMKSFVIAFISVFVVDVIHRFFQNCIDAQKESFLVDLTTLIQLALVVLLCMFIVKKIPEIVNGLLSGNPSLNGGDFAGQMKQAVASGVKAVGTAAAVVATGGAAAAGGVAAASAGGAGTFGKLMAGAKAGGASLGRMALNTALTQNPLSQSFAAGMNKFGNPVRQTPGLGMPGGWRTGLGIKDKDGNFVSPFTSMGQVRDVYSGKATDDEKKGENAKNAESKQEEKKNLSTGGNDGQAKEGKQQPIAAASERGKDKETERIFQESKDRSEKTEEKAGASAAQFPQGETKTGSGPVLPNTEGVQQAVNPLDGKNESKEKNSSATFNVGQTQGGQQPPMVAPANQGRDKETERTFQESRERSERTEVKPGSATNGAQQTNNNTFAGSTGNNTPMQTIPQNVLNPTGASSVITPGSGSAGSAPSQVVNQVTNSSNQVQQTTNQTSSVNNNVQGKNGGSGSVKDSKVEIDKMVNFPKL